MTGSRRPVTHDLVFTVYPATEHSRDCIHIRGKREGVMIQLNLRIILDDAS
jgi:hypothetical protein